MNDFLPHSAEVQMWLDIRGHERVDLCRVSPGTVEAREPVTLPACRGWLAVTVDGDESRTRVKVWAANNERTVRCE